MVKGKKVIPLNQEKVWIFPEGDPRNNMTPEEIAAIAKQEEAELDRILAKAPPLSQIAPSGVEEEEDDEDTEDFKIDLKNGLVTQEVGSALIPSNKVIIGGNVVNSDGQAIVTVTPDMEYTKLLTDALVRQGLVWVKRRVDADYGALEKIRWEANMLSVRQTIDDQLEKLEDQLREIRKAMPVEGYDSTTALVRYENIPEWAQSQVKRYVRGAINQILNLVDESQI